MKENILIPPFPIADKYGPITVTDPTTVHIGDLVYLDTFSGIVPAKVCGYEPGDKIGCKYAVIVRITASRKGFTRGDIVNYPAQRVVPRNHHRYRSGIGRIFGTWQFAN